MKKSRLFKLMAVVVCVFMLVTLFAGCNKDDANNKAEKSNEPKKEESKTINFWFWNADEGNVFKASAEKATGLEVKLTITNNDSGAYVQKLETQLKSGNYFADVAAAEAGFVKRVIEMPNATEEMSKLVQYAADVGKDSKGVQKLVATQATPCGIVYKRKLAKDFLGTDDPEKIGEMFSSKEKIIETAKTLVEKSGKKAKLVPGLSDFLEIYLGGRADAWVKDNKFVIDPTIDEYLDLMKEIRDLGADGKMDAWSEPWYASFDDDSTFAYAAPPWFPTYIVKANVKDKESGNWAVCKGPKTSYWGGTYLGVLSTSESKGNAWKVVQSLTLDAANVEARIVGGTNPDFTSNMEVNSKLAQDEKQIDKLLNQNFFEVYSKLSDGINGKLQTTYDDVIKEQLQAQIKLFLEGKKDKAKMIEDFKAAIKPQLQAKGIQFE